MQAFSSLASSLASATSALEEQRASTATQGAQIEEHEKTIRVLQEHGNTIQNGHIELALTVQETQRGLKELLVHGK